MTDFSNAPELIRVENLHKSFGSLHVLNGITDTIHKGEVVSLIGPSGSGKSTFLRCLNRLENAKAGTIIVDNSMLTDCMTTLDAAEQRLQAGSVLTSSMTELRDEVDAIVALFAAIE